MAGTNGSSVFPFVVTSPLVCPSSFCSAELASERKAKRNQETRSSIQIIKLADNNASLARTNNRLNYQLEKLRKEHDQLIHLHTGQQAVTKAKIGEFKTEIKGLKELLKESLEEKESLLSHLQAKQVLQELWCWIIAPLLLPYVFS